MHVATGAAGDLGELGELEVARLATVELADVRERHVRKIEVEAHTDGVGRDDVVDLTRLVERDLRVAGPRRERAQDDGRAAALLSQPLGDFVDPLGGERDDGAALRQRAERRGAGVRQRREAWALRHRRVRHQLAEDGGHRGRAQQPGLLGALHRQDALGEDVSALSVRG